MDQAQTSDDAPLLTHSTPQSEQTTLLAQQKPLVTIVHASVGSGAVCVHMDQDGVCTQSVGFR